MLDVVAIDPGEKVGWASGCIQDSRLEILNHGISHLKPFALALAGRGVESGFPRPLHCYSVVIYERWRLAAYAAKEQIGSDMQSSQLVGMIRLLGWLHNVKLVSQDPKDMVIGERCAPQCVTEILATLPKAHDESHDGSALKHLAYYWYRHHFDPGVS